MFLSLFIFCRHSTWEPASIVIMSRVTYFIVWFHTGTSVSHSQHRKKFGEALNVGEWIKRLEISKEEIPGSKRNMYGYILTYPRL